MKQSVAFLQNNKLHVYKRPRGKLLPRRDEEVFEVLLFRRVFCVYLQFGVTPGSQSSVLGPCEGVQVVMPCLGTHSSWLASLEVHLFGMVCVCVRASCGPRALCGLVVCSAS